MTSAFLLFVYVIFPSGYSHVIVPGYYETQVSCEEKLGKLLKEDLFVPNGTLVVGKCIPSDIERATTK